VLITETPSTARAYDRLACAYDLLTSGYDHEAWIAAIEVLARGHGATGKRLLDVACGTGKSLLPWLERGYDVTANDVSTGMVEIARAKAGARASVDAIDMRRLPRLGSFDIVTALDDALNHLLDEDDVLDALEGMAANLAPSGVLVFDVNTFAAYQDMPDHVAEDRERLVVWRGEGASLADPGGSVEVRMELLTAGPDALWSRSTVCWRHRHYPLELLRELVEAAGLRVLALHGQSPGVVLHDHADERRHPKALFVCARRSSPASETERGCGNGVASLSSTRV
jgi:SAM-dependent methyltransferase